MLNETDRWTVINALRTAGDLYQSLAALVDPRLTDQFARQAVDARRLAEQLENAARIDIHAGEN